MRLSYVLPLRTSRTANPELDDYLDSLSRLVDLVIVDGSDPDVFDGHVEGWRTIPARHVVVDADLRHFANGKVAGVLTGLRRTSFDLVVIADDDVRYDSVGLQAIASALDSADVVRPQNYFLPLPWHALLDTGRTLLNRISGGDWPGTIGIRKQALTKTGGYDGEVLFENLELVRTVVAAGGIAVCPLDLYVRRLPPTITHFWSQRVRQAYDEFARPQRLVLWLAILPLTVSLILSREWKLIAAALAAIVLAAEAGRRRAAGARVFPFAATLAAPLWVCERAVCAWLAVGARLVWGGIRYHGRVIARAATPARVLHQRLRGA